MKILFLYSNKGDSIYSFMLLSINEYTQEKPLYILVFSI